MRVRHFLASIRGGDSQIVKIGAGRCVTTRVVPPAGEQFAFDREDWTHNIEVYESPTGRSVRVFIDGKEVRP